MKVVRLSAQATEYVRVQTYAEENGAAVDPTVFSVTMAFPTTGVDPVSGDYKTASWETDATTTPLTRYVRALVGPTGGVVSLSKGRYDIWVKITAGAETPVEKVGALEIY